MCLGNIKVSWYILIVRVDFLVFGIESGENSFVNLKLFEVYILRVVDLDKIIFYIID